MQIITKIVHWAIGDQGDMTACGLTGNAVVITSAYDYNALKITCPMCAAKWSQEVAQG